MGEDNHNNKFTADDVAESFRYNNYEIVSAIIKGYREFT